MSGEDHPAGDSLEKEREELLALLAAEGAASDTEMLRIPRRDASNPTPLGFAQEQLWFLHQFDPTIRSYHILISFRLRGRLDVAALEWSLNEVIRRHEALRTVFRSRGGRPVQVVRPALSLSLVPRVIPPGTLQGREAILEAWLEEDEALPFDLEQGPLLRAVLLQLAEDHHALQLVSHHIVVDGWSLGILVQELAELYRSRVAGSPAQLATLPIQPGDHAVWEHQQEQSGAFRSHLAFWREELGGDLPVLELPSDRPRPPRQTFRGSHCTRRVSRETFAAFKQLCQRERVTSFMGLLALFNVLLHRFSRTSDILVGCASTGRHRAGLENLVGMFVNTVVLRTPLGDDPTFIALLHRVRDISLRAFENQDLPFEKIVQELQPKRSTRHNPIFQVGFSHLTSTGQQLNLPGIIATPIPIGIKGAKFDLMLNVTESDQDLEATLEYNSDLYEVGSVEGMGEVMEELMRGVVKDGGRRVSEYGVVSERQREQLMKWAGVGEGARSGGSVVEEFLKRAKEKPEGIAVVSEGREMSYGELERRAKGLGEELERQGVGAETVVGLCVERSVDLVVGILGIWAARGAYVPLDPKLPTERLSYMVEDAKVGVVVTSEGLEGKLAGVKGKVVRVELERKVEGKWTPPGTRELAYVIYTSGSTGKPKGVAIEHGQLASYVEAVRERLELPAEGKYGTVSTIAADLGNTVIFPPLCSGGSVHLIHEDRATNGAALAEYQKREGMDVMKIVPSHLAALQSVERGGDVLPRQRLVLGGEASRTEWVRQLMKQKPGMVVCNHYGPTETTVGAIACEVREEDLETVSGNVPLGKPLKNARVYILDGQQQLVPIGVPGELCIGGSGVGRGYLNREELTREKFLKDPFQGEGRMYRTGDQGRYLSDGRVEFLGRIDQQVKVRGYRVELGEIEAVLKEHGEVRDAVVAVRGEGELVAYVVPKEGGAAGVSQGNVWKLPNGMRVAQVNRNETEYIYQEIFELQAYVKHGIGIEDGGTILDVGANIGLFSVFANCVAKEPRIYAFEPNPVVYAALEKNVKAYGKRTEAVGVGMAAEEGEAELTFFEGFSLLSGFYADAVVEKQVVKDYVKNQQKGSGKSEAEMEREAEEMLAGRFEAKTFRAQLKTVSGFMEERGIGEVELLKVNVEKSEWEVLKGVKKGDWGKIRQLVVEVDVKGNLEPIVKLLESEGYEVLVEQDELLERTELCYVYAIRPGPKGRLVRQEKKGGHVKRVKPLEVKIPGVEELKKHVGGKLPEYMVPSRYVYLEALPLTSNGKVDRKSLPEPGSAAKNPGVEGRKVSPRNDQERVIADIWQEVLGLKEVGVTEDFFELGGHSLRATQVVSRISEALSLQVPLRALFDSPSVSGLSQAIDEVRDKKRRRTANPRSES